MTTVCHYASDTALSTHQGVLIMAIEVPIGGILEVTFEGLLAAQQVMVTHHYRVLEADIVNLDDFVALEFGPWLEGNNNPFDAFVESISDQVTNLAIYVQAIYPNRYRYVQYVTGISNGDLVGAVLPPNDGYAITKRGDQANRHNIGTMHVPGVRASDVTDGILSAGLVALANVLATALTLKVDGLAGATELEPVLWNVHSPEDCPVVTQAHVQPTSRVNRRRTVGVGA